MSEAPCNAFVFFGATGDLAYIEIFPALHAMVIRGHLDMPIVGVAKSGSTAAASGEPRFEPRAPANQSDAR